MVMRFDVVSILPEVFRGFLEFGVCGRALQSGAASAVFWNPREYAKDKRKTTDDRPFGGGSGMVMSARPMAAAIDAAVKNRGGGEVIYLAPRGELLTDSIARELAECGGAVLLCGRYRGVDERVIRTRVSRCISVGDYVLSGGEVAAMALMESVLRHCPGVLGNADSVAEESFGCGGMLDAPCYTRPAVWEGLAAPAPLLSGDHSAAKRWREAAAKKLTQQFRPELLLQLSQKSRSSRRKIYNTRTGEVPKRS